MFRTMRRFPSIRAFLCVTQALLVFSYTTGWAEFGFPMPSISNIGPEGFSLEKWRSDASWGTPNRMVDVSRGCIGRSDNGMSYYLNNGEAVFTKRKDGSTVFSFKGMSIERDADGAVQRVTTNIQGTNRSETVNEKGQFLGAQESRYGGKTVKEYDYENNLTRTSNYNQYGKTTECIVDELSQSRTICNDKGQPEYDVDYEGYKTAVYARDARNKMTTKTDVYGNVTHFDLDGNMTHTEDVDHNVITRYKYRTDDKGNYVLDNAKDMLTNSVTYFKNGKQTQTKNYAGAVVRDYVWDGSTLIASRDRETQQMTWYDINGKATYNSVNDHLISKRLYNQGKLVGVWNASDYTITLVHHNERNGVTLNVAALVEQMQNAIRAAGTDPEKTQLLAQSIKAMAAEGFANMCNMALVDPETFNAVRKVAAMGVLEGLGLSGTAMNKALAKQIQEWTDQGFIFSIQNQETWRGYKYLKEQTSPIQH